MTLTRRASDISPRFLALLTQEGLAGKRVLDLGCGWGRLSLVLARSAGHVVGLDRGAELIHEARERAEAGGLDNVEFHQADVEREDYGRWAPDLITAHLCASDAIVERAGPAPVSAWLPSTWINGVRRGRSPASPMARPGWRRCSGARASSPR